jgi:hypothetical protein
VFHSIFSMPTQVDAEYIITSNDSIYLWFLFVLKFGLTLNVFSHHRAYFIFVWILDLMGLSFSCVLCDNCRISSNLLCVHASFCKLTSFRFYQVSWLEMIIVNLGRTYLKNIILNCFF